MSVYSANDAEANAVPSTSRSVSENSINENLENTRKEAAKRRHSDESESSDDQDSSQQNKRVKVSDEKLDELTDEAQEAQVNELVESATDMGNRLNKFIQNSMDKFSNRPPRLYGQEDGPSTSR
ncbi:hypothetical protein NQ314_018473 [Rhamnusium bicolor]|uniref:Uncharacterized protein n=1 Tax=Rhamnusium bicolor TaxID=1586634 RepID=A0AAV8WRU3_9CUCU|nr:hypothetical protein NQ314_018473 [Rhamnusium bicolor]